MKRLIIFCLRFYRQFISPLKLPTCRFIPSCSQYAIEAVEKYGVMKGMWMSLCRLSRCHPFHPGGYDPVEKNTKEARS
ncbi:MAG: membrane protein insertion efficiency factor YidD [Firmicutes bacterium]|mgnify:FL=1|nr:membrane protein insertion efficiency factor YidD [Bacillota bacterium]